MSIFLKDILAQEKALLLLRRAVDYKKLAHAYLFKGPNGVGKRHAAKCFAAYINCKNPNDLDCCGKCSSCKKLISENHPDLKHIKPTTGSLIKIDQIRKLKHDLSFPPYEANYRVIIIEEIHKTMSRREVANSLLKTLEEPPENTVLILTAAETGNILPTIISRCQVVPFFPLPKKLIFEELITSGRNENDAKILTLFSDGSLGRAKDLSQLKIIALLQEVLASIIEKKNSSNVSTIEKVMVLADEAGKLKNDIDEFLDLLQIWFGDLLLHLKGLLPPGQKEIFPIVINGKTNHISERDIHNALEKIESAKHQIKCNCRLTTVFENLFFALL